MKQRYFRFIAILFLLASYSGVYAQTSKPANWTFKVEKTGDKEYDLIFLAGIKKGLHVYSQHIAPGGPIPTSFTFNKDPNYALVDSPSEAFNKTIKVHDQMFDMDLYYFEDSAMFVQHIKVTGKLAQVTGTLEYMACDARKCFPPEKVNFVFKLPE